ncbi:MAG: hypothetical protein ACTSYD_08005 [Candidatus Heimdallarchaeaceae archaeon]
MDYNEGNITERTDQQKRVVPYIETNICNITSKGKYRLFGSIVKFQEDLLVINDGTGEIDVKILPTTTIPEDLKEGSQVMVLGYLETKDSQIKVVIIQNMSEVDIELYQKVREVEKSIFST